MSIIPSLISKVAMYIFTCVHDLACVLCYYKYGKTFISLYLLSPSRKTSLLRWRRLQKRYGDTQNNQFV